MGYNAKWVLLGCEAKPPVGISTADFHEDGKWGLKLGAYPITFLVDEISKKGILEAMEKGRMYSSKGDGRVWPLIDYFTVSSEEGKSAFMGETLTAASFSSVGYDSQGEHEFRSAKTYDPALDQRRSACENLRRTNAH